MSDLYTSGDLQANYWLGPVTRKEAQATNDEFSQAINAMQTTILKLDTLLSYVCEKADVLPEDFQSWYNAKAAEIAAGQPSPIITE